GWARGAFVALSGIAVRTAERRFAETTQVVHPGIRHVRASAGCVAAHRAEAIAFSCPATDTCPVYGFVQYGLVKLDRRAEGSRTEEDRQLARSLHVGHICAFPAGFISTCPARERGLVARKQRQDLFHQIFHLLDGWRVGFKPGLGSAGG